MTGGTGRVAMMALAVAALAMAYLGAEAGRAVDGDVMIFAMDMGVLAVGLAALWLVFARLGRHFRDLERLRDAMVEPRMRGDALARWDGGRDDALGGLARAASELARRERRGGDRTGDRLAAVAALLEEPVLVLGSQGRVEVQNGAASWLLETAPGDDVYDHLHRPDLFRAIERARESGQPVSAILHRTDGTELPARVADLGLNAGVALVFPARRADGRALAGGSRSVVIPNGRAAHLGDDQALTALPLVALWVATTAAGPGEWDGEGQVIAVGTMRLAGVRVFRTLSLDFFVDPGEPVPEEATARHGVTTSMVEGARPFADAWPAIADALRGCVVVGVEVQASLDALARARARAGLPEEEAHPSLDLGRLARALDPALDETSLTGLARAYGLVSEDHPSDARRGVFLPVEWTADLASAVLTRLSERGVATHGEARAFGAPDAVPPSTAISGGGPP